MFDAGLAGAPDQVVLLDHVEVSRSLTCVTCVHKNYNSARLGHFSMKTVDLSLLGSPDRAVLLKCVEVSYTLMPAHSNDNNWAPLRYFSTKIVEQCLMSVARRSGQTLCC